LIDKILDFCKADEATMTPQMLFFWRETLGLSRRCLGALLCPPAYRSLVAAWEEGRLPLPSHVQSDLLAITTLFTTEAIQRIARLTEDPQTPKQLICYLSPETFAKQEPEAYQRFHGNLDYHRAFIRYVESLLQAQSIPFEVVCYEAQTFADPEQALKSLLDHDRHYSYYGHRREFAQDRQVTPRITFDEAFYQELAALRAQSERQNTAIPSFWEQYYTALENWKARQGLPTEERRLDKLGLSCVPEYDDEGNLLPDTNPFTLALTQAIQEIQRSGSVRDFLPSREPDPASVS
jgi:hypothetical protein